MNINVSFHHGNYERSVDAHALLMANNVTSETNYVGYRYKIKQDDSKELYYYFESR